jgi:hypothetical protein
MQEGNILENYILKLGTPYIKGRFHYGYPLAILANSDNYLEWFLSNFIQIFGTTHMGTKEPFQEIDFYAPNSRHNHWIINNPFLNTQAVGEEIIDDWGLGIIDFLIYQIKRNQYVYMFIDDFFIPGTRNFRKKRDIHNILIYGFDSTKEVFYVAGMFDDIYQKTTIKFEEFRQAYSSKRENIFFPLNLIYLLSHNIDEKMSIDMGSISQSLECYLNSVDSRKIYRSVSTDKYYDTINCFFGLETYDFLIESLTNLIFSKIICDMRLINTFWEHKKTMLFRISFFLEKGLVNSSYIEKIYKDYVKIENDCHICRNLMLKYNLIVDSTGDYEINIIYKVINYLKEVKKNEEYILSELFINL